ncbi:hypothetical protein TYRP_004789 [Tyrophagus putrescentiae]|nr:hypothetical protein TYRP_004789 [Tyrophagus putrescentiae]
MQSVSLKAHEAAGRNGSVECEELIRQIGQVSVSQSVGTGTGWRNLASGCSCCWEVLLANACDDRCLKNIEQSCSRRNRIFLVCL